MEDVKRVQRIKSAKAPPPGTVLRTLMVGFLMGTAELVPGISGGTVALVSGLYDRLVHDIQRFTSIRGCCRGGPLNIRQLWQAFDLSFLTLLFAAMGSALVLLARGMAYLLEAQPILTWAFFFGLILASVWVITNSLRPLKVKLLLAIGAGILVGFMLSRIPPLATNISPLLLFLGGCISVCAWILPGLSGSYVLLILGLYQPLIRALGELDFSVLIYVALGCLVGLLSFAQLLGRLLARRRQLTIAVLTGIMLGALPRVWPWRYEVLYQMGSDGHAFPVLQAPVLPGMYQQLTGQAPEVVAASIAFVMGCSVILLLDRLKLLHTSVAQVDLDGQ